MNIVLILSYHIVFVNEFIIKQCLLFKMHPLYLSAIANFKFNP